MYQYFSGPPHFANALEESKTVKEGSTLSLQCTASGEPKPTIKWSRSNSNQTLSVATSGLLEILKFNRNQTGNYTCSATNPAGTTSRTTSVVVYCKFVQSVIW